MENTGYVRSITPREGLVLIEFYHPKHNSLPGHLLAKLEKEIIQAGKSKLTKVIILKSAGDRTFCAGASFDELISIKDEKQGEKFFMGFANVINACRKCPYPIIGRVHGKAVGGGVGLAAATDYCFASKYASIKLSELNIGIGPFVIGPAVQRKIGLSAFSQLALDANSFYSAQWAMEKGLFNQVSASSEDLDIEVNKMIEFLLTTNPDALKSLKKIFWKGCHGWSSLLKERAALSGKLILSEHSKTAIQAIINPTK